MTNFSLQKLGQNLPASSLTGISQAFLGIGAGLFLSNYLNQRTRDKLALGLLAAGIALTLPILAGIAVRILDNPQASWRVRKQLESIRRDSGFSEPCDSEDV
ncbi:MAG: hypothetical protein N2035_00090 [Chthoniobacterales bacterium]|nr:hypothetical protein [Chthoniobacterales bacterium]